MALQTTSGMVELLRPDGCRVQVEIGNALTSPEIEADIAQVVIEAEGADGDICNALTAYAHASGMTTQFFVGRESLIVAFSDSRREQRLGTA